MSAEFRVPVGQWPVHSILRARGSSEKCEYLVDWKINPLNGDLYKPSWVGNDDFLYRLLDADANRSRRSTLNRRCSELGGEETPKRL